MRIVDASILHITFQWTNASFRYYAICRPTFYLQHRANGSGTHSPNVDVFMAFFCGQILQIPRFFSYEVFNCIAVVWTRTDVLNYFHRLPNLHAPMRPSMNVNVPTRTWMTHHQTKNVSTPAMRWRRSRQRLCGERWDLVYLFSFRKKMFVSSSLSK